MEDYVKVVQQELAKTHTGKKCGRLVNEGLNNAELRANELMRIGKKMGMGIEAIHLLRWVINGTTPANCLNLYLMACGL